MFDSLIVQPIFNLLVFIYGVIPGADFGIALILFTIIIRFLMYPLLKKQLHQSRAMQRLQPELKRIQAQYKDNPQLQGAAMMELYKKHNVSPWRSILIMVIQIPIFIGLFQVIQVFSLHRDQIAKFTYDFLEGIPAIHNIIQVPDSFNHIAFGFMDLTKNAYAHGQIYWPLLVLAVIGAVTQYIMAKQTMPGASNKKRRTIRDMLREAADGKQHDQAEMNQALSNNMVKILPIMMFFIMISLPGALAVYYVISNLVGMIQQHFILKEDVVEMEEIAEEPVINPIKAKNQQEAQRRASEAKEAHVTKIVAKDSKRRKN
jgi:YidC/Oxa1 family membrane protein insertase